MAVTGAQCIASCTVHPETVAKGLGIFSLNAPLNVIIEHPSGQIDVLMDFEVQGGIFQLHSAGILRTARLIARGELMVPTGIL